MIGERKLWKVMSDRRLCVRGWLKIIGEKGLKSENQFFVYRL